MNKSTQMTREDFEKNAALYREVELIRRNLQAQIKIDSGAASAFPRKSE